MHVTVWNYGFMVPGFETVLVFLGVCLIAYVTPGPDWFVVMRNSATSRRSGLISALGVQAGLAVHMVAAVAGVTAVILASATAFSVLKYAGAAYLVFLGVQSLWRSRRTVNRVRHEFNEAPAEGSGQVFWKSFTANVLNPQAAMFFVAVLPQFISPNNPVVPQVLLLGILDIALGLLWWGIFVYGVVLFRKVLGSNRFRSTVDRVSGSVLIVLGTVLAFMDPPDAPASSQAGLRVKGAV